MTLPTTDQVLRWVGMTVHDTSGTEIGTCQNVYADDDTQVPEWIEVALPDDGAAMVPTLGASVRGDVLTVAHPLDRIRESPRFPADVELEVDDERALYDHYGVRASTERSDTLLPDAARLPGDGEAAEAPAAPRPRKLRRIEPVPTAPPPPALPAPSPAPESADRRPLLALLAVPAGLLLARWLRQRREPDAAEVGLDVARRVTPVVAPLAAGLVALVWQRRRTKAAGPLEVTSPPQLAPAPAAEAELAVVAVAETPVVAEVPLSDVAVEQVAVVEDVAVVEEVAFDEVGTGQAGVPPVVPVSEVVDRNNHRPV